MANILEFYEEISKINLDCSLINSFNKIYLENKSNSTNFPLSTYNDIIDREISNFIDREQEIKNEVSEEDFKNYVILFIYIISIKYEDSKNNKDTFSFYPNNHVLPEEIINKLTNLSKNDWNNIDPARIDNIKAELNQTDSNNNWVDKLNLFTTTELQAYGY